MIKRVKNKTKIIFFGTPEFAVPFLNKLVEAQFNVAAVVTAPDNKIGRKQILTPSPIKLLAKQLQIPVLEPTIIKNNQEFEVELKKIDPEICVLTAFGKIISLNILNLPRLGFINVHPSLLPKYRGPSPVQGALLAGEKETGITLMKLDEGVDTGDILFQKKIEIQETDTAVSLRQRLSNLGANFLVEKLDAVISGEIKPQKQNHSLATYTKIISRAEGEINFNESVKKIANKGRAYHPWPGLFTQFQGKRIKLVLPRCFLNQDLKFPVGTFFLTNKGKFAIMANGGFLMPLAVQLEGKKELTNQEFVQGYREYLRKIK